MITPNASMLLASAALAISVNLTPSAHVETATDLPPDVVELVKRRSGCLELSQRAFDPDRRAQLESIMDTMRSLNCGEITLDEKALREKYASSPEILEALKATWVRVVKRLPVNKAAPPESNR